MIASVHSSSLSSGVVLSLGLHAKMSSQQYCRKENKESPQFSTAAVLKIPRDSGHHVHKTINQYSLFLAQTITFVVYSY